MDCPAGGLQVFMQTSIGRRGGRILRLFRGQTSLPVTGNGNTKRKHRWTSISQSVRLRVRGLFLTCILFLLESRCPSVRGCPQCETLINHKDGCKQVTKSWHVTTRHQAITTIQENDENCQEKAERGSHDVSGPWIEVTIIPVGRLKIVHLEKSLWRCKKLICGKPVTTAGVRYAVTLRSCKRILMEEIATDVTFLVR